MRIVHHHNHAVDLAADLLNLLQSDRLSQLVDSFDRLLIDLTPALLAAAQLVHELAQFRGTGLPW